MQGHFYQSGSCVPKSCAILGVHPTHSGTTWEQTLPITVQNHDVTASFSLLEFLSFVLIWARLGTKVKQLPELDRGQSELAHKTCAPSPVSVKCPVFAPATFLSFESHRSHTEWVSTTTLSSSAAVTTVWSTPPISPKPGRKSSFSNAATSSAALRSLKKSSPAFFFPNVLTSSHSFAPKSSANSIFRATAWKSCHWTAPFLLRPTATTSGASTITPSPSAIFAATPALTPKPMTNSPK